mmetsp:Transcript_93395/g.226902  ORF Transcript_93395/g.226902 Transcript_93395/m.226902 type:complete len:473 (-) Transcript_93395:699-2117(-)
MLSRGIVLHLHEVAMLEHHAHQGSVDHKGHPVLESHSDVMLLLLQPLPLLPLLALALEPPLRAGPPVPEIRSLRGARGRAGRWQGRRRGRARGRGRRTFRRSVERARQHSRGRRTAVARPRGLVELLDHDVQGLRKSREGVGNSLLHEAVELALAVLRVVEVPVEVELDHREVHLLEWGLRATRQRPLAKAAFAELFRQQVPGVRAGLNGCDLPVARAEHRLLVAQVPEGGEVVGEANVVDPPSDHHACAEAEAEVALLAALVGVDPRVPGVLRPETPGRHGLRCLDKLEGGREQRVAGTAFLPLDEHNGLLAGRVLPLPEGQRLAEAARRLRRRQAGGGPAAAAQVELKARARHGLQSLAMDQGVSGWQGRGRVCLLEHCECEGILPLLVDIGQGPDKVLWESAHWHLLPQAWLQEEAGRDWTRQAHAHLHHCNGFCHVARRIQRHHDRHSRGILTVVAGSQEGSAPISHC